MHQVNELHQVNEVHQVNEMNQGNEVHHVNEVHQVNEQGKLTKSQNFHDIGPEARKSISPIPMCIVRRENHDFDVRFDRKPYF